jgi:hypothetical protein
MLSEKQIKGSPIRNTTREGQKTILENLPNSLEAQQNLGKDQHRLDIFGIKICAPFTSGLNSRGILGKRLPEGVPLTTFDIFFN